MKFLPYQKKRKYTVAALGLVFSLSLQESYVHAMYDNMIEERADTFKHAGSQKEKFEFLTKHMDKSYVWELNRDFKADNDPLIKMHELYPDVVAEVNRTHLLALAICHADVKRVGKFLKAVENPNDPALIVWGYRQPYNMVSLAADPIYPITRRYDLHARLQVIDLLSAANFDFNFMPRSGASYRNPPLISATALHGGYMGIFTGDQGGRGAFDCQEAVQARLMLHGANPKSGGTTQGPMSDKTARHRAELAFHQALEEKLDNLRPVPYVQGLLAEVKKKELSKLYLQREMLILEEETPGKLQEVLSDKINYLESWKL